MPRKKSSKCKITKNKAISSQLVLPEPKKSTSTEESYDDTDNFLTVKQEPVDFPDEELSDSAQPSTSITDENIEIKGKFPIFFSFSRILPLKVFEYSKYEQIEITVKTISRVVIYF